MGVGICVIAVQMLRLNNGEVLDCAFGPAGLLVACGFISLMIHEGDTCVMIIFQVRDLLS